ncbi:MAG: serine/threonine protein kinase [Bacteroidia bacterium]|nr:serine/threonine protein kinase [Bacteroidia bacterium]MDW8236282.1 serine/threonine-protein kinase [Bacteroidia bacterium]
MSALLGKTILNYRVEKLIGQGGMGEVYMGVHTEIERKVAIKVISPHLARDPKIQERFKREALIMARLNHPNIVQLYEYWARPEEGLFLIMEYVEGISLDRYIYRVLQGPIPPKQAIDIFLQVLDAFQYAHQNNVVHRDIKPSNILLRNDGVVKVLDFGIARMISPDSSEEERDSLTRSGTALGTVAYMSPEQVKAKSAQDIDHRSDIYSLGVVLFEMLTGKAMYDRTEFTEFEVLVKIATESPPSLREWNSQLAGHFDPILDKALAKNREDRYQSCQEFAADLLKILPEYAHDESRLILRNPAYSAPTVSDATANIKTSTTPTLNIPQPALPSVSAQKRKKVLIWGGVGAIIVGVIIGAVIYLQSQMHRGRLEALAWAYQQALATHDTQGLLTLFHEELHPIFTDIRLSREKAINKYYRDFWADILWDSVRWVSPIEVIKYQGEWYARGWLYHKYQQKPQVLRQSEKRYNRAIRKYETVYLTKEIIMPAVCREKEIWLKVEEGKIVGVEVRNMRECR